MDIKINQVEFSKVNVMLLSILADATPAMVRSLNRTMTGVRTDKSAAVRAEYNLKKSYVDQHITIRKAKYGDPTGQVDTRSTPSGLINFGARTVKTGVSVQVKKSGARSVLPHAFIATVKNADNVFWRAKPPKRSAFDARKKYGKFLPKEYRLPIERRTGPRISDALAKPDVIRAIEAKAGERWLKEITHEVNRELARHV